MSDDLRISEAAALIGVHENTVRNAIKKGALRATMKPGPWGREQYAIHPKVFAAWYLERYGKELVVPDGPPAAVPGAPHQDLTELYERLIESERTVSRYLALEESNESVAHFYQKRIAELQAERDALTEELTLARRPWYVRIFKTI